MAITARRLLDTFVICALHHCEPKVKKFFESTYSPCKLQPLWSRPRFIAASSVKFFANVALSSNGIYQPGRSDKLFIRWRFFCSQHLSDWRSRICIIHLNHSLILISQSVQHKRGRDSRWYSIKQSPTTIISDTESYSAIFRKKFLMEISFGNFPFIFELGICLRVETSNFCSIRKCFNF